MNENSHYLKINEGLYVNPPLGCSKINGPKIDHLACHKIILLKASSSVIEKPLIFLIHTV